MIVNGGRVKCWGQNQYGQLGIGSLDQPNIPVDVGLAAGVWVVKISGVLVHVPSLQLLALTSHLCSRAHACDTSGIGGGVEKLHSRTHMLVESFAGREDWIASEGWGPAGLHSHGQASWRPLNVT